MNYLRITFKSSTTAPIFDEFTINPAPYDAVEITLSSSKEDKMALRVKLPQTSDQDLQKAEDIALILQKQLTFYFERHVHSFKRDRVSIEHDPANLPQTGVFTGAGIMTLPAVTFSGSATFIPPRWNADKVNDLKTTLERSETEESRAKIDMFCSAVQSTDAVAKYMMLYLIGMSFCDDDQRYFDEVIRQIDSTVVLTPGYRNRPETMFTRLRNQIGHNRHDVTFADTRQEMEQNIPGLIRTIKELVTNGVPSPAPASVQP